MLVSLYGLDVHLSFLIQFILKNIIFALKFFSGNHKVSVKYGGVHAPGSPFKVAISPKSDASKVKVTGPGVEPTGVQPGKPTYFTINASEAGKGDVHVKVEPVSKYFFPVWITYNGLSKRGTSRVLTPTSFPREEPWE